MQLEFICSDIKLVKVDKWQVGTWMVWASNCLSQLQQQQCNKGFVSTVDLSEQCEKQSIQVGVRRVRSSLQRCIAATGFACDLAHQIWWIEAIVNSMHVEELVEKNNRLWSRKWCREKCTSSPHANPYSVYSFLLMWQRAPHSTEYYMKKTASVLQGIHAPVLVCLLECHSNPHHPLNILFTKETAQSKKMFFFS